jgi:hypothetical protein
VSHAAVILDKLVQVSDVVGHMDTRTTEGYRHQVRPTIPHAIEAWGRLLAKGEGDSAHSQKSQLIVPTTTSEAVELLKRMVTVSAADTKALHTTPAGTEACGCAMIPVKRFSNLAPV